MRWTLVARAADSRARRRERHLGRNRPRAGDGPATADHAREERLPALGGLVGEDDAADAISCRTRAPLGERLAPSPPRRTLDPWAPIARVSVSSCTPRALRRQQIRRIEGISEQRMFGQRSLEPDEEEVGEVGVGNRVVVRRIGEPDMPQSRRQRMTSQRRQAALARARSTADTSATRRSDQWLPRQSRFPRASESAQPPRNPRRMGIACRPNVCCDISASWLPTGTDAFADRRLAERRGTSPHVRSRPTVALQQLRCDKSAARPSAAP